MSKSGNASTRLPTAATSSLSISAGSTLAIRGLWQRPSTPKHLHIEESIPAPAVDYYFRFDPWGDNSADFVLEARLEMASTLGQSDPRWTPPQIGDVYGMELVHTDPDGGSYGGHFIIYGTGDDDLTWGKMVLVGPAKPIEQLEE